ncbi:MAG: enhanced serine sensitivity protein SseB, partial [Methanothrix sp.]|nr:enhanced serine sensitivity protein SseB [Methanothrix sp.]
MRAIEAYGEALKIRTIENYPISYALTQNNLAAAYRSLADVRDKEANLMLAIEAYGEALKILDAENYPTYNSMIKESLRKVQEEL